MTASRRSTGNLVETASEGDAVILHRGRRVVTGDLAFDRHRAPRQMDDRIEEEYRGQQALHQIGVVVVAPHVRVLVTQHALEVARLQPGSHLARKRNRRADKPDRARFGDLRRGPDNNATRRGCAQAVNVRGKIEVGNER